MKADRVEKAAVAAAVLAYAALAVAFALRQPIDLDGSYAKVAPPDESAHVEYLRELSQTWRLPVFRSGSGNYEAHQPPLYYLACLPAYLLGSLAGPAAAVIATRLFTAAVGLAGLVAIWAFAREALAQPLARAICVWLAALWPARLAACGAVSNDAAAELAAALCLWFMARVLKSASPTRKAWAGLGATLGAAALVKSSCLFLLLPLLYCLARQRQSQLSSAAAAALGFVVVWGPWAARNVLLYGDPLAARAFAEIFSKDRATPEYFFGLGLSWTAYFELVAIQTAASWWGVYGQANLYVPAAIYWLGFAWLAATAVVCLVAALRPPRPAPVLLSLIACFAMAALFIKFNTAFYQAQARYFMPATAAWAALAAYAWNRISPAACIGAGAAACILGLASALCYHFGALASLPPFFG